MHKFFTLALISAVFIGGFSSAEARKWKPTPEKETLDYLQIQYVKPDNTIIFLQWIAPAMFKDTPAYNQAREMTSKYAILLVGHAKVTKMGEWRHYEPKNIIMETANKEYRRPLSKDEIPPTVFGFVSAMSKVISQGLGALGKGMVYKVYSAEGISACGEGGFWINYAGERFDYKTPLPGCDVGAKSVRQSRR